MNKLVITTPTRTISLLPVPRKELKPLRELLVEVQSYWLSYAFGVGELVADDYCWGLLQAIANKLPHEANPAVLGVDLDEIQNDYQQIESLFLCRGKTVAAQEVHGFNVLTLDEEQFVGGAIVELHLFNPRMILVDARVQLVERDANSPPIQLTLQGG